jgi:hypothetical protein
MKGATMAYERKAAREARIADEKAQLRRALDADVPRGVLTMTVVDGVSMYALAPAVCGTPDSVPLFPVTCDCGAELHDFDEAAAHECPADPKI